MKLILFKSHIIFSLMVLISFLSILENVLADNRFVEREIMSTQQQDYKSLAKEWNVTEEEYRRYQSLMSGARGIWTPDADPLLVLGSHAKSESERRRFAELYVRKEHERIEGELKFQLAVDSAWKQVFPNKSIFDTASSLELPELYTSLTATRYAIFLKDNCSDCSVVLENHLKEIEINQNLKALDIYVLETSGDDNNLRNFVSKNNIPVEMIREKRITVNHGNEYRGKKIPAVFVLPGDGKWQLKK